MPSQTLQQADRPRTYRAEIVVPAEEDAPARLVRVKLDEQETACLQQIADSCSWSLDTLVRQHVSQGLPRHVEVMCGIDLRRDEQYTAPTLREQRGEVPRYRQLSQGHEQAWTTKVPLADWRPVSTADTIHFDPHLSLLTPTLSDEATTAVVRSHHATGDNLDDIVDGVVLDQIGRALGCVSDRRQADWQRTAQVIFDAAARRRKYQSDDPLDGPTGFENTVIVALPPAAHAMMRAIALDQDQGSVETLVRKLCMTECRRFAKAILDPGWTAWKDLFNSAKSGGGD